MPWYYASRDAKPAGPVTLDELRALRAAGTILPETYVIEHTGEPGSAQAWRRYSEVVPAPIAPAVVPGFLPPTPAPVATHPLFPSAGPSSFAMPAAVPDMRIPAAVATGGSNGACMWGFSLGLLSFLTCGIGFILAFPALLLSLVGFGQAKRRQQSGRGLAMTGIILSLIALLMALGWMSYFAWPFLKSHAQTATEQTSNDTE